jgi:DNA-binding transcriptional MerR regulator
MPDEMPIRSLATAVGVSTATINFYVQQGVLPAPRKLNRTRAAYSAQHLRLLKLIRAMQASGYSLAQVKDAFAAFGIDERGLRKMEGIGMLRPLPASRADADQREIEPFAPVGRRELAAKSGVSTTFVDDLVRAGLLRPLPDDRFDARDLWALRAVHSMVADGARIDDLAFLSGLTAFAERARPLVEQRAMARRDELLARTLRFAGTSCSRARCASAT